MKIGFVGSLVVALATMASSVFAGNFSTYHIGNSLSQDMYARVFPNIAKNYGVGAANTFSYGYHFRPSTSVTFMHQYPLGKPDASDPTHTRSDVNRTTQGQPDTNLHPWNEALDGYHMDAVTMQPYYPGDSLTSNMGTDTTAINAMIAEAKKNGTNTNTRYYIYAAWPSVTHGDLNSYSNNYLAATQNSANQNSTQTRDYTRFLTNSVRLTNPDVSVIPLGEIEHALDVKMRAGLIPEFTAIRDIHRDAYHMNSTGQNIAAYAVYAAVFKKSPVGLPMDWFDSYPNNPGPFGVYNPATSKYDEHPAPSSAALASIQQTVWEVLNDPNWIAYTNVPEPVSGVLLVGGLIGLCARRWRRTA